MYSTHETEALITISPARRRRSRLVPQIFCNINCQGYQDGCTVSQTKQRLKRKGALNVTQHNIRWRSIHFKKSESEMTPPTNATNSPPSEEVDSMSAAKRGERNIKGTGGKKKAVTFDLKAVPCPDVAKYVIERLASYGEDCESISSVLKDMGFISFSQADVQKHMDLISSSKVQGKPVHCPSPLPPILKPNREPAPEPAKYQNSFQINRTTQTVRIFPLEQIKDSDEAIEDYIRRKREEGWFLIDISLSLVAMGHLKCSEEFVKAIISKLRRFPYASSVDAATQTSAVRLQNEPKTSTRPC